MKEVHRDILRKRGRYLLDNVYPQELLWAALLEKKVLSYYMVEEIKACSTQHEQIGKLLDLLPKRGPDAFNDFCVALLESDHEHVARQLKVDEGELEFRHEIRRHQSMSEETLNACTTVLKKNSYVLEWLAEQKYAHRASVQADTIENKETVIDDLQRRISVLEERHRTQEEHLRDTEGHQTELKGKMQGIERENTGLEETRNYLKAKIHNFESKIEILEQEFSELQCSLLRCSSAMVEMSNNNNNKNNDNDKQDDQLRKFFVEEEDRVNNTKVSLEATAGCEVFSQVVSAYQVLLQSLKDYGKIEEQPVKLSVRENTARYNRHKLLYEVRQLADMFKSKSPEYISEKLKDIQGMIDAFFVDVSVDEDNLRIATQEKRRLEGEVLKLQENYQNFRRREKEIIAKKTEMRHAQIRSNKKVSENLDKDPLREVRRCHLELMELEKEWAQQRTALDVQVDYISNLVDDVSALSRQGTDMSLCLSSRSASPAAHNVLNSRDIRVIATKPLHSLNTAEKPNAKMSSPTLRIRRLQDGPRITGSNFNFPSTLRQSYPTKSNATKLSLDVSTLSHPSNQHTSASKVNGGRVEDTSVQVGNENKHLPEIREPQIRERKRSTSVIEGSVSGGQFIDEGRGRGVTGEGRGVTESSSDHEQTKRTRLDVGPPMKPLKPNNGGQMSRRHTDIEQPMNSDNSSLGVTVEYKTLSARQHGQTASKQPLPHRTLNTSTYHLDLK